MGEISGAGQSCAQHDPQSPYPSATVPFGEIAAQQNPDTDRGCSRDCEQGDVGS